MTLRTERSRAARVHAALLAASLALVDRGAHADDKTSCAEAAVAAQRLRNAHKLVEASAQLVLCGAASCPAVVQRDCAAWAAEVQQDLPTIVVSATDRAGRDQLGATVRFDDGPPVALDGQAIPMDPGPHDLHVAARDGAITDAPVLVKEGVKNQAFSVVLRETEPTPTPTAAPTPTPGAASGYRTAGWIVGAAGLAGLGVATAFGFVALSDKNGAHCDASGGCDPGPLASANTAATASTAGFVAGGALVVGGLALVLLAPRSSRGAGSGLRVVPSIDARQGGLVLAGTFR